MQCEEWGKAGWEMPTEARSHRALCAMVRSWDLVLKIPIGGFSEEEQRLVET